MCNFYHILSLKWPWNYKSAFSILYVYAMQSNIYLYGNILSYLSLMWFFSHLQSTNIWLVPSNCEIIFGTIAKVVAHNLMNGIWLLFCIAVYSYRFSNYCNRSKELIPKMKQKIIWSNNFIRRNREKSNIAITVLEKLMIR